MIRRTHAALWATTAAIIGLVAGMRWSASRGPKESAEPEPASSPIQARTERPQTEKARGVDHWFQAVLIVFIGVVVDRLRESYASETITVFLVVALAVFVAVLAERSGIVWLPRFLLLGLVAGGYLVAEFYLHSPSGEMPGEWAWAILLGGASWCIMHMVSPAWFPFRSRPLLWSGDLTGFVIALLAVGPFAFGYVFGFWDQRSSILTAWDWVAVMAGGIFGLLAILYATTSLPHRFRFFAFSWIGTALARLLFDLMPDASPDEFWAGALSTLWPVVVLLTLALVPDQLWRRAGVWLERLLSGPPERANVS